jgi:hypothetical protein
MSDATINLLLQIPLAGVVVVVVVVFLKHLDKSNSRQDAAQDRMIKFLAEQEESNRAFLREQREANSVTIGRLADRIEAISKEVSTLNGVLSAHDARSQERSRVKS